MRLSVIIPTCNEAATLPEVVERVRAVETPGLQLQVVVVDDGSTDGTPELVDSLLGRGVDVALRHGQQRGRGACLRTAIPVLTGDYAILQEARLDYDPADYHVLMQPVLDGKADVVFGSRFMGGRARRVSLFWNSLANRGFTALSNALTDLNLTDVETGYKLIPVSVLHQVNLEHDGFGVDAELVAKMARMQLRFFEVGITFNGQAPAPGMRASLKDGAQVLGAIVKHGRGRFRDYGKQTLQVMEGLGAYAQEMHARLRPYYGQHILEIGSGIGNNVDHLAAANPQRVILTDYRQDYVELLRHKFVARPGVTAIRYDAMAPPPADLLQHPPDTIVCLNVLEHILDDRLALQNMFATLSPGGRLVMLVPAFQALYCEIDRNLEHHRRYSMEELVEKMQTAGFAVSERFYFNPVGAVGWFVVGRVLGARQIQPGHARGQALLMPVMKALDRLNLPFGLSVVAIGEKPGARVGVAAA